MRPRSRTCLVDEGLPDCGTGPAGRLSFVLREARAAWRRSRSRSGPVIDEAPPALPSGDTR